MEARQDGILMNGDGEVFDTLGEQIEITDSSATSGITTFASRTSYAKTTHSVPTEDTQVCVGEVINGVPYYYDANCGKSRTPKIIPFLIIV